MIRARAQVRAQLVDVQTVNEIALSGVIGSLSYALDIAEGQPPGHAVRSCLIGMRLAAELEMDSAERSHLFYALLAEGCGLLCKCQPDLGSVRR